MYDDATAINDVTKAIAGDKDAFSRLIIHYEGTLYNVARSILKLDDECLDAAQEAIIKAYTSISTLKEPKYFKTWLIRILINECYQMINRQKKVVTMEDIYDRAQFNSYDTSIDLKSAINSLEKDLRLVVTLFYFEDVSINEISEISSVPSGTVKSRLNRARAKLAKLLSESQEEGCAHIE